MKLHQTHFTVTKKIDKCQVCHRICFVETFTDPPPILEDQWQEGDSVEMCPRCYKAYQAEEGEYRTGAWEWRVNEPS